MQQHILAIHSQIASDYDAGKITATEANERYKATWPRCQSHNTPAVTTRSDGTPECHECVIVATLRRVNS